MEILLTRDTGSFDDAVPAHDLGRDQRGEFLGCAGFRHVTDVVELLHDAWQRDNAADFPVKSLDDFPRHTLGRGDAAEGGHINFLCHGSGERRHLWELLAAGQSSTFMTPTTAHGRSAQ